MNHETRFENQTSSTPPQPSGFEHKATEAQERGRSAAAGGLDSAAEALHSGADALPSGGKVSAAAHSAADALASGADYLRGHDLQDMVDDLVEVVKNNPGPALLGAVALGFLMGRAFSRD